MPIRGCVLVICNSFVSTKAERVRASTNDAETMKELWGDMLRCDSFPIEGDAANTDFFIHKDVTAQGMVDLLANFANHQSQIDYSYIVVVISTHGGLIAESWVEKWDPMSDNADVSASSKQVFHDYRKYVAELDTGRYIGQRMTEVFFGNDFRPVRERKLKELFYNDAAVTWQDVPKFFLLSYCRGDTVDCGVIRSRSVSTGVDAMACRSYSDDDIRSHCDIDIEAQSIMPRISDVLVAYATHHSYVAYRDGQECGSWLLSNVGKVFKQYAKKMHVVDMLTIVNQEMKKTEGEIGLEARKAMSIYESSLDQNLYLCDEAKRHADRIAYLMETETELESNTDQEAILEMNTNNLASRRANVRRNANPLRIAGRAAADLLLTPPRLISWAISNIKE